MYVRHRIGSVTTTVSARSCTHSTANSFPRGSRRDRTNLGFHGTRWQQNRADHAFGRDHRVLVPYARQPVVAHGGSLRQPLVHPGRGTRIGRITPGSGPVTPPVIFTELPRTPAPPQGNPVEEEGTRGWCVRWRATSLKSKGRADLPVPAGDQGRPVPALITPSRAARATPKEPRGFAVFSGPGAARRASVGERPRAPRAAGPGLRQAAVRVARRFHAARGDACGRPRPAAREALLRYVLRPRSRRSGWGSVPTGWCASR